MNEYNVYVHCLNNGRYYFFLFAHNHGLIFMNQLQYHGNNLVEQSVNIMQPLTTTAELVFIREFGKWESVGEVGMFFGKGN